MLELTPDKSTPSLVFASFPDGIAVFELPGGATLIDLAQRLDGFVEAHIGAPTNISIRYQTALPSMQPSSPNVH